MLIDEDPYGPSYPDSAIQHLSYRIGILVIAVFMIILGKSNLVHLSSHSPPTPSPCIEDALLDAMQPLTNLYITNEGLGLALVSLMQVLVDFQLVGGLAWWFLKGSSMRYPLLLAVVGISKILLNVLLWRGRSCSRPS